METVIKLVECQLCGKTTHTGKKGLLGTCLNLECENIRKAMRSTVLSLKQKNSTKPIKRTYTITCSVCSKPEIVPRNEILNKTCSSIKCRRIYKNEVRNINNTFYQEYRRMPTVKEINKFREAMIWTESMQIN